METGTMEFITMCITPDTVATYGPANDPTTETVQLVATWDPKTETWLATRPACSDTTVIASLDTYHSGIDPRDWLEALAALIVRAAF